MSSITERLDSQDQQLSGLRTKLISQTANDLLFSALGEYVIYGCKVTGSTASPLDRVINLEGQASGDSAYLNPEIVNPAVRGYEYPNIASCKDGAFRSEDTTATVEAAPATGEGRYDIAYLFVGPAGAGFAIQTGTPAVAVKTDFDSNGLDTSLYGAATITDPDLPKGAMPLARIYVEDDEDGISDTRIADLRVFQELGAPGMVLLSTTDISTLTATLEITGISSAYDEYILKIHNLVPETDGSGVEIEVSTDGGSTWETASDYKTVSSSIGSQSGARLNNYGNIAGGVLLHSTTIGADTNEAGISATVHIIKPAATGPTQFYWHGVLQSAAGYVEAVRGGAVYIGDPVDAIRIFCSVDDIDSGSFKLYGVKK